VATRIRAIIFDIGRVLVRIDIRRVQLGLAKGLSLTPEELWSAIEKDPNWRDWQEGRMSARDWHLHLSKRLGIALNFDQFTSVWNSTLDPQPIHPDSLFEQLSKSFKLGLLSNTDAIHVAYLESTYTFFRYFPKSVRTYSCVVGVSKPDPLVFRQALRSCNVRAEQAIYVDDIAAYAQAARGLGLQAIHYKAPEQLRQELLSHGAKLGPAATT
jgi:HAD superfamily hydrolase (TIGR01509 family)